MSTFSLFHGHLDVLSAKYLSKSIACFPTGWPFVFFFIDLQELLCILDMSPSLDICVANSFSQFVVCLFTFLMVSFDELIYF